MDAAVEERKDAGLKAPALHLNLKSQRPAPPALLAQVCIGKRKSIAETNPLLL
jgi:hypothetical protein